MVWSARGLLPLLIMLRLGKKQRGIEPFLAHQLGVPSLFHNLAAIDDENPVGHFDRGQPVAD